MIKTQEFSKGSFNFDDVASLAEKFGLDVSQVATSFIGSTLQTAQRIASQFDGETKTFRLLAVRNGIAGAKSSNPGKAYFMLKLGTKVNNEKVAFYTIAPRGLGKKECGENFKLLVKLGDYEGNPSLELSIPEVEKETAEETVKDGDDW